MDAFNRFRIAIYQLNNLIIYSFGKKIKRINGDECPKSFSIRLKSL